MSCDTWLPMLLVAAEDRLDELDVTDRDRLATHLARCADCRDALDEQRAVRAALTTRNDAPVPVGFATRVAAHVTVDASWIDMLQWRTWSFRLAPLAVGLLLVAAVTTQSAFTADETTGLSDLAEVWAFGGQGVDTQPAFTILGQDGMSGDMLLNTILSAEADDSLAELTGDDAS